MNIQNLFNMAAVMFAPTERDWQPKIDAVVEKYHASKELPRKKKKQRVKELNSEYSFLMAMQRFEKTQADYFNF